MTNEKLNVKLGNALKRNSIFSLISGLTLLVLTGYVSSILGFENEIILRIIGIVLIIFAVQLRAYAFDPRRQKFMGRYASINDILWVLGSVVILIIQPDSITQTGSFLIATVSLIVLYFATSQLIAIAEEVSSFELSRKVEIPTTVLWPIISDVEGFVKHADTLSSTKIVSGNGQGMIRRCHDLKDQGWNETCISWVDGETYTMEVDTSDYPYPFKKFQGTWSVKSIDEETSLIALRYDYIPKYGIFGKVMTNRMFSKMAEDIINNIIDNYIEEAQKLQVPA